MQMVRQARDEWNACGAESSGAATQAHCKDLQSTKSLRGSPACVYFVRQSKSVRPQRIGAERLRKYYDALSDIHAIRGQIARGTEFRGYGPASIAASGFLAFIVAAAEARWFESRVHGLAAFLTTWIATAAVSVVFTGVETIGRARRVHSGFAREMIRSAAEQFVPALMAGMLLTVVLLHFDPRNLWMLPGLWQIVFSLGVFASCRFLPRQMFIVGLWYLSAGLACLAVGGGDPVLSPWAMGIPFGVGQLLVAAVLQFGYRKIDV